MGSCSTPISAGANDNRRGLVGFSNFRAGPSDGVFLYESLVSEASMKVRVHGAELRSRIFIFMSSSNLSSRILLNMSSVSASLVTSA